jgi:hypothetical protein
MKQLRCGILAAALAAPLMFGIAACSGVDDLV